MIQKLTWNEFYCLFDKLLINIESYIGGKFQKVVGIANGGINISIPIANKLRLPHQSVLIHRDTSYVANINFVDDGVPFILVDDICDSGKTVQLFNTYFIDTPKRIPLVPRFVVALYATENKINKQYVDVFAAVKTGSWVEFPLEVNGVVAHRCKCCI